MKIKLSAWIILTLCFLVLIRPVRAADIYVSPTGSDRAAGTKAGPLASISMALRKARELRRLNDSTVAGGIRIWVNSGVYRLFEPIFIRPEDSGTENSPTIIQAAGDKWPVVSGGIRISGWKKAGNVPGLPLAAKGKVWVADVPPMGAEPLNFRQLWVNDKKAVRARTQNDGKSGNYQMDRILSWNHKDETCWIPKGYASIAGVSGVEMLIHQWWATAVLRIKAVTVKGDSARLSFYQPESRIQSEHPWPAPWQSKKTGNSAFYLSNAIQFLDTPGEWYLDVKSGKVYYWPRSTENLAVAEVIVPNLETLVNVEGSVDKPVANISFQNIAFKHAGWLRPSKQGHVALQAGMYFLDAYKLKIPGTPDKKGLENQAWLGRPAAAVGIMYADNIAFNGCRFEHLAATGLDFRRGTHNVLAKGNLFKDIGGTAVQLGMFSDEATETHLPYNPTDKREICVNAHITNNLINDATNEDWGTVAISAGYVKGANIEHNDISEISYSGICVGWGWTKTANASGDNRVYANRITHYARYLYDVAAVYTLSAQPGTVISENYIDSIYKATYAHDPEHWFYLYLDEGSSGIIVKDNWCPKEKFLQNANGPGNVWENNGPMVKADLKNSAGLQADYQFLLKERVVNLTNQLINR